MEESFPVIVPLSFEGVPGVAQSSPVCPTLRQWLKVFGVSPWPRTSLTNGANCGSAGRVRPFNCGGGGFYYYYFVVTADLEQARSTIKKPRKRRPGAVWHHRNISD